MAGGGSHSTSGGSSNANLPSWQGGTTPDTFDTKKLGTTFMSDAQKLYAQGPKVNPISTWTDLTDQTKGLISGALANNNALQGNSTLQGMASGSMLGEGNPYLNAQLQQTRDNVMKDVGSQFTNSGRFGGGSYVDTAVNGLANAENSARFGQYNTDVSNMFNAQNQLQAGNAGAIGYSNLLDQNAAQKTAADRSMWDATNNAGYNHITSYMNLINGGKDNSNQPLSLWDILSGVGSVAGAAAPFLSLL